MSFSGCHRFIWEKRDRGVKDFGTDLRSAGSLLEIVMIAPQGCRERMILPKKGNDMTPSFVVRLFTFLKRPSRPFK
ncbi:MAG: hypothetical protein OJF51_000654 [Nitrospira sp.]|nr:MAG: hypothetical protein OJF51_000654 [Nitrospira sp.]